MKILSSTVTSKGQTTIPAEVRKMFGLKPNVKILWISLRPGELSVVAKPDTKEGEWAKNLCGKYKTDDNDAVDDFIKSKQEDILLEQRGFLKEKP